MVDVVFDPEFRKKFLKIKEKSIRHKIQKQIRKLEFNPELGKPMMYGRKGSRELYISPYRLSYILLNDEVTIIDLYHKDKQ